jgi:hypothetical protein
MITYYRNRAAALGLIVILLQIFHPNTRLYAQSDTVRYRELNSYLIDSTLIRLEVGSIGFKTAAGVRYLQFQTNSPTTVSNWFATKIISSSASTDSIYFHRWVSYDDKHVIDWTSTDTARSSSGWTTLSSSVHSRYIDTFFYVSPDTSVFGYSSRIRYIVELEDSATGSALLDLDTIVCFRKAHPSRPINRLVYATSSTNNTNTWRSLAGAPRNHPMYLTVRREVSLPLGSTVASDNFFFEARNGPAYLNHNFLDQVPYASLPSPTAGHQGVGSKGTKVRAYFDHANDAVVVVETETHPSCEITVRDLSAKIVARSTHSFSPGSTVATIDVSHLATGVYMVELRDAHKLLISSKMQIIH